MLQFLPLAKVKIFCETNLQSTHCIIMWKNEKFTPTIKISRQSNSLVNYLASKTFTFTKLLRKEWCEKQEIHSHGKFSRGINSSRNVDFTNFCHKSVRVNFCNFYTSQCGNYANLVS